MQRVGDEGEYVRRGRAPDPWGPTPFIRVPLMAGLSRACHWTRDPIAAFRGAMVGASLLSVALTALGGWILGGFWVGLLAGTLFLIHPERVVLSRHLWPDAILALWVSAINLSWLAFPIAGNGSFLWLGLLMAIAAMTRIDALALALGSVAWLWTTGNGAMEWTHTALICAPTLLALLLYAARNGLKYGVFLPDTTIWFNLSLWAESVDSKQHTNKNLDAAISHHKRLWDLTPFHHPGRRLVAFLRAGLRHPLTMWRGFVNRLWGYLGPDQFIRQKVLHATQGAYPQARARSKKILNWSLHWSFPVLFAWATVGASLSGGFPARLVGPTAALALAGCLVHSRTRFRLAILPTLCLAAADALPKLSHHHWTPSDFLAIALAAGWLVASLNLSLSQESTAEENP